MPTPDRRGSLRAARLESLVEVGDRAIHIRRERPHCLPVGMADQPSAGTGTVMRPDTLGQYASVAGFTDVDVLPIHHDFFRFYRLTG